MKDYLNLSDFTFHEAIAALYGSQLDDIDRVVQTLLTFYKLVPSMRINTFYQQAVHQRQFAYRDFKFLMAVLHDMDGISEIIHHCKDTR